MVFRALYTESTYLGKATWRCISIYRDRGFELVWNIHGWPKSAISLAEDWAKKDSLLSFRSFKADDSVELLSIVLDKGAGFDAIICSPSRSILSEKLINDIVSCQTFRKLRVVGTPNDSISIFASVKSMLDRSNLAVLHTSGVHALSVAEYTFGMFLAHARRLPYLVDQTGQDGRWPHDDAVSDTHLLKSKALAVVGGSGRDGSAVIALGRAFSMDIRALASGSDASIRRIRALGATPSPTLAATLTGAQFVSLNCRLSHETKGMIGTDQFAVMSPGAVIINPAGAELIDKSALIAEFKKIPNQRRIGTLVCDMPYGDRSAENAFLSDCDNALLKRIGVQFTPRSAGYTSDSRIEADAQLAERLLLFLTQQASDDAKHSTSHSEEPREVRYDPVPIMEDLLVSINRAGVELLRLRDEGLIYRYKEDGSPVTNADELIEHQIIADMRALGHQFTATGEEHKDVRDSSSSMEIVIDGIDGTRNYRDFNYGWCISVAVVIAGCTVIGIVSDPQVSETYVASEGTGSKLIRNGSATQLLHGEKLPSDFSFSIGSFRIRGSTSTKDAISSDIKQMGGRGREWGCVALSICAVARGGLGTFIQGNSKRHDHLAAVFIAQQAGAIVTLCENEGPDEFDVLVSHRDLADKVLESFTKHASRMRSNPS